MKGGRCLSIEIGSENIADQTGSKPELPGVLGQVGLPAAMIFEPTQILGELGHELSMIRCFHQGTFQVRPVSQGAFPKFYDRKAGTVNVSGLRSSEKNSSGIVGFFPRITSDITFAVPSES